MERWRIEKFWDKVQKSSGKGCWVWTGATMAEGYGHVRPARGINAIGTHRFAWIVTHGKIPRGLCVLHKCDNPPCCRPDHLFLGTKKQNARDKLKKGRARWANHDKITIEAVHLLRRKWIKRTIPKMKFYKLWAERLGVGGQVIRRIIGNRTWRTV